MKTLTRRLPVPSVAEPHIVTRFVRQSDGRTALELAFDGAPRLIVCRGSAMSSRRLLRLTIPCGFPVYQHTARAVVRRLMETEGRTYATTPERPLEEILDRDDALIETRLLVEVERGLPLRERRWRGQA